MKTKLLALALLAGGTMFAQTRFSIGITVGGNNRGYYAQPAPYAYAQPYNGYQAQPYYDNGYANQGYARANDRGRDFDRDRDRDDDRDRDRGNGRYEYRQQNSYRGGFRDR